MGRAMVDFTQSRITIVILQTRRAFRDMRDRCALPSVPSPMILDCDRGDGGTDLVETVVL